MTRPPIEAVARLVTGDPGHRAADVLQLRALGRDGRVERYLQCFVDICLQFSKLLAAPCSPTLCTNAVSG
jgi:hypothetical protein